MNDEQTPALRQAVENMANMREAYNNLSQAAEAYNTGKTELAANITAKGVPASASETLPELAEKVNGISQESYTIDGGEMYTKQLFGVANNDIIPGYWNLYEVLANLLSDGRLVGYGGILLAEYYRGYDSLALAGAGAGGAYVVSDKDSQGNFIMYTNDTTHVWDTKFDGKGNRWVAYCFADEYHDFQITDTNTSPRSIFIGRKVGTITSIVNGRVSEIVVPDGNELIDFRSLNSGYSVFDQNFGKNVCLRNLKECLGPSVICSNITESVYIEGDTLTGTYGIISPVDNNALAMSVIVKARVIGDGGSESSGIFHQRSSTASINLNFLYIECENANNVYLSSYVARINVEKMYLNFKYGNFYISIINKPPLKNTKEIFVKTEGGTFNLYNQNHANLERVYIDSYENDKTQQVTVTKDYHSKQIELSDIILQDGWCKPLDIRILISLTKENVQAHIFDRLGVNDLSTGVVTLTLATAVLNLFTQEEIDAVVARTNITIVGA